MRSRVAMARRSRRSRVARRSAHETIPGHASSTACLALATASKPSYAEVNLSLTSAYDACVRFMEAPEFLLDECLLLRLQILQQLLLQNLLLQNLLLQPHEEGSKKGVSDELGDAGAVSMQKRSVGRVKVQVRKLKSCSSRISH